MATKPRATVSGPGIDRAYPDGPAVALSAAITLAGRVPSGSTLYVRTPSGAPYGRVERAVDGVITIHRTGKETK